jgi:4-hydroxybenzoate polyprenyltransferase
METIQSRAARGRVADAPSGHWVYRILPRGLWPYAQLARWDRPIGWELLLWPCWWSAAMAASAYAQPSDPLASLLPSLSTLILLFVGAFAMRGAGCTYNDLVDENIDNQVERTRSRPLPSGQVSRRQAWAS